MSKEKLKLDLFRLKKIIERSEAIDFDVEYNDKERKIIDLFEVCAYRLKAHSDERTDSIINLIHSKETSFSNDFWKLENDAKYKMFGTMLGVLDGTIDDIIKNGNGVKSVNKILDYRKNIQSYYINLNNSNEIRSVDSAILSYPSSKYFLKDYSAFSKNDPYFTFILNYTYAYSISDKVNIDVLYSVFDNLLLDVTNHVKSNREYIKSFQK